MDLLQNLEIVEKRPSNASIKKKEAEKGGKNCLPFLNFYVAQSNSPKKFHAHRNEAYEKKNGVEKPVQIVSTC